MLWSQLEDIDLEMGSSTRELLSVEIQDSSSILESSLWPGGGTGAGENVTNIRKVVRHLVTLGVVQGEPP